ARHPLELSRVVAEDQEIESPAGDARIRFQRGQPPDLFELCGEEAARRLAAPDLVGQSLQLAESDRGLQLGQTVIRGDDSVLVAGARGTSADPDHQPGPLI